MKKIIFSIVILFTVIFSACDSDKKFYKKISITADTTIMMPGGVEVKTAPRWSCSGKKLSEPKLLGVENGPMVPVKFSVAKDTVVAFGNEDIVPAVSGNSSYSSNEGLGFLPDLFRWLLGIILIALTLWGLWWLVNNLPRRSIGGNGSSAGTNAATGASNRNNTENITSLTALATAIGNAGGGTVEHTTEDGFLFMKIGPDAPMVNVVNSGAGASSDGITVHVGDEHRTDIRPVFPVQKQEEKPSDKKEGHQ